jgi:hypothetical protein
MDRSTTPDPVQLTQAQCTEVSGGQSYGETLCEITEEAERNMKAD